MAWRQMIVFAWRYIGIAFASLIFMAAIPILAYMHYALSASVDDVIYTLLAIAASGLSMAVLEVLMIERMLAPARRVLIPQDFEKQISGMGGFGMLAKFQTVVFVLIIISVLLIAPIGYHQTTVVLYEEIGSLEVLSALQMESLIAAIFAVLLGLGLSLFMARSISSPIRHMIETFGKIEVGDLRQRVSVTSTDEVGELGIHFNRMINRLDEFQESLEQKVASRTEQLKATIEVGRVASSILSPDELINKVVNMITNRFGYYYAAIFLIDPLNRWAELSDATGEAGETLKAQRHKLEIGRKSMVNTAITTKQACIALDTGAEPVRFDNPLLPNTRSEIALPLLVGDRVIGVLDVQSTSEAAFSEDDIDTLQGMANQVAIALENAHLFQETQKSLEELRAAHRLYVTDAWSDTAREHGGYEFITGTEAIAGDTGSSVNVPLTLREQVIGKISLEGLQDWSPEEKSLIEAVATQAALALENARLLEESQQIALRERLAAEITGKIWTSPTMDFILQTAVKELGRALRADEATIELKMD
ncbi:MAG: GAF domain-containing protein [Geobacteraceae bacterium]|nr:GAF domain-containing protein [Geobacteraceae bacterium]